MRLLLIGWALVTLASRVEAQVAVEPPATGLRIAAEVAGALVGTGLATTVSYPFGKAHDDDDDDYDPYEGCPGSICDNGPQGDESGWGDWGIDLSPEAAGFTLHGLIAPALIGGGVAFAGHLFGMDGDYWAALAGSAAGMVGGMALGITAIDALNRDEGTLVFMLSVGILPVLGALVGYELTAAPRAAPSAPAVRVGWTPFAAIAPDARGALLGARFVL